MPVDYTEAHKRIVAAFFKGLVQSYGLRRMEKKMHRFARPGRLYWDKNERWVDPDGKEVVGRFCRKPSTIHTQEVEIPRGVIPEEALEYANAVSGAFLETLRIMEEAHMNRAPKPQEEVA